VEVDGPEFHQDSDKERQRELDLDVPVLHLQAAEVGQSGVVEKIQAWARGLLA
jgi:hypothetical protein